MKVLMINTVYAYGSTGKIVEQIEKAATNQGITCVAAHRYQESTHQHAKNCIPISTWLDCHIHNRLARYTMLTGCFSKIRTHLFLKKVKKFKPDIIHLHNIHGNYINVKQLFRYIKKHNIPVVWTLHDCWILTGHCFYYDIAGCHKWQTRCHHCPQKGTALVDASSFLYNRKKQLFHDVQNMTLVTPSQWLADEVALSHLKDFPTKVINNGIDLSVFRPVESSFRFQYGLENKTILLGVAFDWGYRKGLDIFIELAKRLDNTYKIVLVGTNDTVDEQLPSSILSIHKTNNQTELAEIYSTANLFVNPTREDNFPTVNIESLACGTPVLTFNTGGSPEIIDETSGSVVDVNDIDALEREIYRICQEKPYTKEACLARARQFDRKDKFEEYVHLYQTYYGDSSTAFGLTDKGILK